MHVAAIATIALDEKVEGQREGANAASIAAERRKEQERKKPKEATANATIIVTETRTRRGEGRGKRREERREMPTIVKSRRNTGGGKAVCCRCCDRGSAVRGPRGRRSCTLI
jgi:hypothetical protein